MRRSAFVQHHLEQFARLNLLYKRLKRLLMRTTHKAALMYKSTLQVVIVVISQCTACEMQSQVVYTCSAGLGAVKVRYLELVVT